MGRLRFGVIERTERLTAKKCVFSLFPIIGELRKVFFFNMANLTEHKPGMHVQKRPHQLILAVRIQRVANPARGFIIHVHNKRLLPVVKILQRNVFDLLSFFTLLVTVRGAVNCRHAGMGDLGYPGMTFAAVNFAMGGGGVLGFIDMQHPEVALLFKPHQSWILMAGKTAALIEGQTI